MIFKKLPSTRLGWHQHFAKSFNKNSNPRTAQMSLWYLFLHLAFDAPEPTQTRWIGIDVFSRDADILLHKLSALKSTKASKGPNPYHGEPVFSQVQVLTEKTEDELDFWLSNAKHGAKYVGLFEVKPC